MISIKCIKDSEMPRPIDDHINPEAALRNHVLGASYCDQALTEGIFQVTFVKKDGTIRKMNCTRNDSIAEYAIREDGTSPFGPQERGDSTQVRCWDVDKEAWRSFSYENVISFEMLEEII
jgi:hypothetical protein